MKQNLLLFVLLIGFVLPLASLSQTPASAVPDSWIENYAKYYQSTFQDQAALFLGKVQQPLTRRTESLYLRERTIRELDESGREKFPTPVPARESYSIGNLDYDGVYYTDVFLRLDLYRDELVVRTPNEVYGVILDPVRVKYANFRGYHVVYIGSADKGKLPVEGYYQELHNNEVRVLRKEFLEFNRLEDKFVHRTVRYYIQKDGNDQRVRSRKGSILKALGGHRRELDQFIRRNNFDIKRDMDRAVVQIVSEYERLNQ